MTPIHSNEIIPLTATASRNGRVHVGSDGGHVVAGYKDSYGTGYRHVYLIKTDADGKEVRHVAGKENLDFPYTFATDPNAIEKGVGPQPDAFNDFWFNKK